VKISGIETFLVAPRWLFMKVSTDEGISGWGEPVVEGRAETVRAAVHELADLVVGQDPLRIEDHWQLLRRSGFYRGGPVLSSALSGYDQALWDIAGKARSVPVHELLGGAGQRAIMVPALRHTGFALGFLGCSHPILLPTVSRAGPRVSAATTATTIDTAHGGPRVRK